MCRAIAGVCTLFTHLGLASPENNTSMEPQGIQNMSSNTTNANIVLVHGTAVDGFFLEQGNSHSTERRT